MQTDGRFAAAYLGLLCLPVSHKKGGRLIWVKTNLISWPGNIHKPENAISLVLPNAFTVFTLLKSQSRAYFLLKGNIKKRNISKTVISGTLPNVCS